MLLGMDLVLHASKGHVSNAILLTGDSDFVPAVQLARREGVVVCLVHSQHPKQPQQAHSGNAPSFHDQSPVR